MHIALGDGCPLDVLRIDSGERVMVRHDSDPAGMGPHPCSLRGACTSSAPSPPADQCALLVRPPPVLCAADGHHAFASCMVSYGFMGDVMAESENYRWLGPLRYDVVRRRQAMPCMLRSNRRANAAPA